MKIMRPVAVARLALQAEAKKEQSLINEYVEEGGSKKSEPSAKASAKEADDYEELPDDDVKKTRNDDIDDEIAGAKSEFRDDEYAKDSAK